MDIMMGLSAIKQTLDITKDLREIDDKISVADLKLRLSDIVERLLEAREALYDAKERERELLEKIAQLEAVINRKPHLKDDSGLLFELNGEGQRVGEPYCNQCYVKEGKLYRLVFGPYASGSHICSNCNGVFGRRSPSSFSELRTDYDPLDPYGN